MKRFSLDHSRSVKKTSWKWAVCACMSVCVCVCVIGGGDGGEVEFVVLGKNFL